MNVRSSFTETSGLAVSVNLLKRTFKELIISDYMHENFNILLKAKISLKHLKNRLLIKLTLSVLNFFKNNYAIKAKENNFIIKF